MSLGGGASEKLVHQTGARTEIERGRTVPCQRGSRVVLGEKALRASRSVNQVKYTKELDLDVYYITYICIFRLLSILSAGISNHYFINVHC